MNTKKIEFMNYSFRKFFPYVLLPLIILACQSNNQTNNDSCEQDNIEDAENTSDKSVVKSDSYYLFPAPGDILKVINSAELMYNEDLLNSPSNVDNYIDSKSQAIHLGGYLADLAYISLFGMHEQALAYLSAIQKLSKQAHIDIDALNQKKITSLLSSKNFKDSLLIVSNNTFFEMIAYLESNKREDAVSMFSIGAFIESMYIATFLLDEYSPENDLIVQISKQQAALTSLMAYAEENKKADHSKYYALEEINQFLVLFEKCELVKNANNQMVIKKDDFELFKLAIKHLRERLIGS